MKILWKILMEIIKLISSIELVIKIKIFEILLNRMIWSLRNKNQLKYQQARYSCKIRLFWKH